MKVQRTFLLSEKERLDLLKVKEDYPIMEAEVFQGQNDIKGGVRTQSRDTNRYAIEWHNFHPELLKKFTDFVNEEGIVANQTDYLEYGEGQFFEIHQDSRGHINNPHEATGRMWSTSTLLDQTDDLEGGELLLYGPHINNVKNNRPMKIDLQVGETVFFPSHYYHEVTPVTKGLRTALVVWLGDTHKGVMKRRTRVDKKNEGATFL